MNDEPTQDPDYIGPIPAAEPLQLTEAERLHIENGFLKMQNVAFQVRELDNAKEKLLQGMKAQEEELNTYRKTLSAKYGVEITRQSVTPEGFIRTGSARLSP